MFRLSLFIAYIFFLMNTSYLQSEPRITMDQIVVIVNSVPVTEKRLAFFYDYLKITKGSGLGWPFLIDDYNNIQEEKLLQLIILDDVLWSYGNRLNSFHITEKALKQRISQFYESANSKDIEAFIKRQFFDDTILRRFFIRRLRIESYIQLKVGNIRTSEKDIEQYFDQNKDLFVNKNFSEAKLEIIQRLYLSKNIERFHCWANELLSQSTIINTNGSSFDMPRFKCNKQQNLN